MKKNVILLSVDALRPDRLSCNGYRGITTPNIDEIAASGTVYDDCIAASCLTPVSMASVLTAKYPSKHGLRNPFGQIDSTTVTELFKNKGYATAGFTGINFLSERCKFNKGFDVWDEPTEETGWFQKQYQAGPGEEMTTQWGNWWPPKMMEFLAQNKDKPFFVWGHYFEVHFHAEKWMLKQGMLEEGVLADNAYYDAKVKYLDEHVIGPLNKYLKDNKLWDSTMIVLMSDHGETMMRKPSTPLDKMDMEDYPKHRTLSQGDLRSTLIMKGVRQPHSRVSSLMRSIDIVPTILDVCFDECIWDADGQSLYGSSDVLPAYSEELFEKRGDGALQSIQDSRFKLKRNNTTGDKALYDLHKDPNETDNIIKDPQFLEVAALFGEQLDKHLIEDRNSKFKPEDEEVVTRKLRELGYI